jgi:Ca2+-binding RTX toxin-like protein
MTPSGAGNGEDSIQGGHGEDWIDGGTGNDSILGGTGNDSILGGEGNDAIDGGWQWDTIDAGNGNDSVWGGNGNDTLYGRDGNDWIDGGSGNDSILGGTDSDSILGGEGNDAIDGGWQWDTVDAGDGNDSVWGGNGEDSIQGGHGEDWIDGGTGNDSILGGTGNDSILGGEGNDAIDGGWQWDTIDAGNGNDSVWGGNGNDTLYGRDGNDWIDGGSGNDSILGGTDSDSILGGEGNDAIDGGWQWDTVDAGDGNDSVWGGNGEDSIQGGHGEDWIDGGTGNDSILGGTGNDSILGGEGNDAIDGGWQWDTIDAGNGNDSVWGGNGNDTLYGRDGNDWIDGGSGNDSILGGTDSDSILGGEGNDAIDGGWQWDTVDAGDGNDSVWGGNGEDSIQGGHGEDWIDGGTGNDSILGGTGNDSILGGEGNDAIDGGWQWDTIDAGNGNDSVWGGNGNDTLYGRDGNDWIDGGSGNDTLDGGAGDDVLIGSAGADVFVLSSGNDTIVDFNAAEGDTLQGVDAFMPAGRWTADSFMKTFVSYGADGTVLQLADGSSITFLGDVDMSAVVAQLQLATETTVVEGEGTPLGDAENGFDTQYTIEVGDSVTGSLGFFGDIDWFRIDLEEGQLYDFAQSGVGMDISIHSGSGARVAGNNDSGFGGDFQLYFAPQESGTYYIEIEGDLRVSSGSYDMSVTVAAPDSINSIAGHLSDDYWNSLPYTEEVRSGPRQFETGPNGEIYYDSASLLALPLEQFELAILAMTAWESYADVVFVGITAEDENPEAGIAIELEFQNTGPGAFTNFTFVDEDPDTTPGLEIIDLATVNVGQDVIDEHGARLDSFSYLMYLYTLGRALGLGNAGFYDDRNGDPIESTTGFGYSTYFYNDSWQTSVMSAFSQTDNLFIDATEATSVSPMMADIMAIQSIYGARQTSNDGDTIYGANSTASGYGGSLSFMMRGGFNPPFYGGPVAMTLYDTGGNDTIDASFSDADQTIRLTGGSFSDIGGYTGNVAIYLDTVIENAIGGGGNDTLLGNAVGNRLEGGAGDDVIDGGGGTDTAVYAIGSTEAEVTVDEDGVFEVVSSLGTDTLANIEFVAFADKTVRIEELARFERVGGDRSDIIFGFDLGDSISGLGGDDELFGLAGDDIISGGNGADLIEGGRGNDILFGDAGDDTIYGDAGQDSLNGGTGDDLLTGGAGADVFVFLAETETGSDRILDFSIADADRIALDSTLWGRANLTTEEVIDQYAVVVGSSTVFVFDGGQSVTIDGVANPMSLVDHIDII